jgi:hypothetical protein
MAARGGGRKPAERGGRREWEMSHPASRRCRILAAAQRRCASLTPTGTLCGRHRAGRFRAAPCRLGAAGRGARAGVARARLRAPHARAHAAVRAGAGALPGLPRTPGSARPSRARLRARRVRRVSALRRARPRVPARSVRTVPRRTAGGVLVQEARPVPELRRAAHGGVGETPGRRRVRPASGAAVGIELPVPAALPVRQQTRGARPGAGHRATGDRRVAGRSSRRAAQRGAHRRGDADPTLRQRAQPQRASAHAMAGRRIRAARRPQSPAAPRLRTPHPRN